MTDQLLFSGKQLESIKAKRSEELNDCGILAKMPLPEAGMAWLESRRPFLGPRTQKDYEGYLGTIVKFFGNVSLEKLADPDLIRLYQMERNKTAGASIINHECSLIEQMLKRIEAGAGILRPEPPWFSYSTSPTARRGLGAGFCFSAWRRLFKIVPEGT